MPWKVINQMDLKLQLINSWNEGCFSKTDLSQRYGISRPTVYKWLSRHKREGVNGLSQQSRAPRNCPHRTPQAILDLVIREKLKNRKRGPRKVRAQLKRRYPALKLPAISTIGYWLKKEGLVEPRKKRWHVAPYTEPFAECRVPNDVWSMDFKGQFHLGNGCVCYPFTLSDNFSRYLLRCTAMRGPRHLTTKRALQAVFREYGLPNAIRNDNGQPFAGRCIGGLSRLSMWLIQLGIVPERIEKGCPEENGRHERMHRTLKSEALDPIGKNFREQQDKFDIFQHDYNNNRPHESLDDKTPSDYYQKSNRPYVEQPHPVGYGYEYAVRRVRNKGEIKFMGREFFISEMLIGELVGLKETGDGFWQLQYGFYVLGGIDLRKNRITNISKT